MRESSELQNLMTTVTDHLKSIPRHGVHAAFSTKDMVANTKMPHHMNSVEACRNQPGPTALSEDTCISLAHSIKVTADVPSPFMSLIVRYSTRLCTTNINAINRTDNTGKWSQRGMLQ